MEKKVKIIAILMFLFVGFSGFALEKAPMYVAVKSAKITEKTSAMSKKVGTLPYGTAVLIDKRQNGWCYVISKAKNVEGWLPEKALTKKNILSRGNVSSANAKEIALAGKGFSAAIEEEYAKTENIDYSKVDLVETYSVSFDTISQFMEQGMLLLKDGE